MSRSLRAVWGLWTFFTAAAVGFMMILAGILDDNGQTMILGAGLMAFATLLYLFVNFLNHASATFAIASPAGSLPVRSRPVIGRPAFSASSPRIPREPVDAPAPATAARVSNGNGAYEEDLVVGAAAASPSQRYRKEHFVPAVARRNEWVTGLPLLRTVLGETSPATDPARPGKTRGQCSGCGVMLWAPAIRPIRLRCPQCSKVAWLEK